MTTGRLIIDQADGDPVVVELDIPTDADSITIEVTSTEVKIHTPHEPKVVHTHG